MADYHTLRQRMVDNQIRPNAVTDPDVISAFLDLSREAFVAEDEKAFAYAEREIAMSEAAPGRRMLLPMQLARLAQALALTSEAKTLVVGCGSGYSAALLARLAASVVGLEEEPVLAKIARERLAEIGADNVMVAEGPLGAGWPVESPYDAILVEGAVEVIPDALIAQLRPGGTLATILRSERISQAMIYERTGEGSAKWPQFEAWATLLPGFQRKAEFVF